MVLRECVLGEIYLLRDLGFPGGSDGKVCKSACRAGDLGLIPGSGRSTEEGNGNPLQFSCLENSMDRGAWGAEIHGVERVRHDSATITHSFICAPLSPLIFVSG